MTAPSFTPEQTQKLDALLAEGEALERELDIHPIVRLVTHELLEEDGVTFQKAMSPETGAAVWRLLEDARKARTLNKAVFDLARLAVHLDQDKHIGRAAFELLALANDAVVKFDLLASMDHAQIGVDEHRDVTGSAAVARPAMVGDKAPEGSMKVDRISPKRRI